MLPLPCRLTGQWQATACVTTYKMSHTLGYVSRVAYALASPGINKSVTLMGCRAKARVKPSPTEGKLLGTTLSGDDGRSLNLG